MDTYDKATGVSYGSDYYPKESKEPFVFDDGAKTLADPPDHNGEVLLRGFNFYHGTPARWFSQNWWILVESNDSLVWIKLDTEEYRVANPRHGRVRFLNATGFEFRWYERKA